MTKTASPTGAGGRIASLDVLRGFALLGILVMNIQLFSMPSAAYQNPAAFGDLTGINLGVWTFSHVFFSQKFLTLFSMLFGAGVCLFADRIEARGGRPAKWHYRRMGWLLAFGLAHAYLLWAGDILVTYAICGCLVYLLRRRGPRTLVVAGGRVPPGDEPAARPRRERPDGPRGSGGGDLRDQAGLDARRLRTRRGDRRLPGRLERAAAGPRGRGVRDPRGPAAVLRGVVLRGPDAHRHGALQVGHPERGEGRPLLRAAGGGGPACRPAPRRLRRLVELRGRLGLAAVHVLRQPLQHLGMHPGRRSATWASSCSRCAGVSCRVCRRVWPPWEGWPSPTTCSRPSLCTTIFYGHGLGLFASAERYQQLLIVFAVWALQLWLSPIWMRRYSYGPLEWLWRTLTYGRLPRTTPRSSTA